MNLMANAEGSSDRTLIFSTLFSKILLLVILLKPVVDFFWDSKFLILGREVSPTVLPNFLVTGMVMALAARKRDRDAALFLFLSLIFLASIPWNPLNLVFSLRYWASMAGIYFLYQLDLQSFSDDEKKQVFNLFYKVCIVVVASTLLQLLGLVPFLTQDRLISKIMSVTNDWKDMRLETRTIYRLSGLYYHPLDLVRVLVWPYILCVTLFCRHFLKPAINANTKPIYLFSIFALNLIVYLTTHRTTVLLFLFFPMVAAFFVTGRRFKFRFLFQVTVPILFAWALGTVYLVKTYEISPYSAFLPGNLLGIGLSEKKPGVTNLDSLKGGLIVTMHANGRGIPDSGFWPRHLKYFSSLSPKEKLFGNQSPFPAGAEAEPHNLVLDLLERFGFFGTFFFLSILVLWIYRRIFPLWVSAQGLGKLQAWLILITFFSYNLITEALNMPTFAWWMLFYTAFVAPKLCHET